MVTSCSVVRREARPLTPFQLLGCENILVFVVREFNAGIWGSVP